MNSRFEENAPSLAAEYLDAEFTDHADVVARTREMVASEFARLVSACSTALRSGHKLLFFGNGGSAADAQHLATELVVRHRQNRRPFAAIVLTTDTSALTAHGTGPGGSRCGPA